MAGGELRLDPDRLLPADGATRAVARRLYEQVAGLPIVSPHGHVPAALLADDQAFADPVSLLVSPDHYVTRLLHASGVGLDTLGVGRASLGEDEARAAWRVLCSHWAVFAATPVRYWLTEQLVGIFGVTARPGPDSADELFDQISARLAEPAFRPRALLARFGIDVLATTDDPVDDLAAHTRLAAAGGVATRVLPTFRPDAYLEAAAPGWRRRVERLATVTGRDTATYAGWVAAMEDRRAYFRAHGAVATDHGHIDAGTQPLERAEAAATYRRAWDGEASGQECTALRRHMVWEMARMAADDGLVMTMHPGVLRGHHRPTSARFGPDTGHDIPVAVEFTRALRPLLSDFGTAAGFRLVLFSVDESVFSRELAPLAGFYPCVYLGAPWWFLDAPAAVARFRQAVTETAGFSRTAGFVDDTRALCSLPVRHDMARRLDAGYLAGLVVSGVLAEDEAGETALDLVAERPRAVFGL